MASKDRVKNALQSRRWRSDPENLKKHKAWQRAWYLRNRERILETEMYRSNFKLYGLDREKYDALVLLQGGLCAICEKPEANGRRLCVDHSHDTGKVRQLLCNSCNVFLGRVEANDFDKYKRYLAKHAPAAAPKFYRPAIRLMAPTEGVAV